jgi:hypothetical protein
LFAAVASITVLVLLWANGLSHTGAAAGLTPIFFNLFTRGDYQGATCALIAVLVAAFVPQRHTRGVLAWIGTHTTVLAAVCFVLLCFGTLLVYRNTRLSMDEYAQFLQSQIFASGHLTGQFPVPVLNWLIPPGFQNFFLDVSRVSGHVASAYWPSFALLMTPFTLLGISWACNPAISALTLLVTQRLALRIFGNDEAAGLAVLLTAASPVFFGNGISYYAMSAHLLANAMYALLLLEPTRRRAFAAGLIGSVALTLHNPVPHMLFAAPWIISIARRPGGVPIVGALFAGYLPLCLLLGVGWFFFLSHLTHDGVALAAGTRASGDSLVQMGSAFDLPNATVLLARAIGVAKAWAWSVPGLLLLSVIGAWKWRRDQACRLLAISALLTLLVYVFVPVDQGHGWGYRYFHSAWIALPILATAAFVRLPDAPPPMERHALNRLSARAYFVALALSTLLLCVPFRAFQMHEFISRQIAQVPQYAGNEHRVMILDASFSFYGLDLVQNDPFLRGNVIRMVSHGRDRDAAMMQQYFPDMHRVAIEKYGSVWSAAH